jgi:L-arabinose isomerase
MAWILAGGAHHSAFSQAATTEMLEDFATIAGVEFLIIDADTKISRLQADAADQRSLLRPQPRLGDLSAAINTFV